MSEERSPLAQFHIHFDYPGLARKSEKNRKQEAAPKHLDRLRSKPTICDTCLTRFSKKQLKGQPMKQFEFSHSPPLKHYLDIQQGLAFQETAKDADIFL